MCNGLSWVGPVSTVFVLPILLFARQRRREDRKRKEDKTKEVGGKDDQVQTVDRVWGIKACCMCTVKVQTIFFSCLEQFSKNKSII